MKAQFSRMLTFVLLLGMASNAFGQQMPGLAIGGLAPPFQVSDQFGKKQRLSSLMGPKGLVLLFFRSADW